MSGPFVNNGELYGVRVIYLFIPSNALEGAKLLVLNSSTAISYLTVFFLRKIGGFPENGSEFGER